MKDFTEAVFVEFDPLAVSYEQILRKWKSMSDPYPAGVQYRTAVFYLNEKQEEIAKGFCNGMEHVDVELATKFYMAEERHQNFLARY
jgi:peptide-methionine (S)-S-oxide reductase